MALAVALVGCVSRRPVFIDSDPRGAKVEVKNQYGRVINDGMTPVTLWLNRYSNSGFLKPVLYTLTFTKEGFEDSNVYFNATINSSVCGVLPPKTETIAPDPPVSPEYPTRPDRRRRSSRNL